ncbi:NERD domain-containing protein [Nocardia callitridis]
MRQGAQPSGAEQEFVECLRTYPTTALAVIDVEIGDRRIDALIFTPYGPIVLDVCGFRRRQSGILALSATQPWTVSNSVAELDSVADNPIGPLEHAMSEVGVALEQASLDPGYICGAIVLVPFRGAVVRPGRTNLRPGLDVVVGNASDTTELRIYLEGFSDGSKNWTADRVRGACAALGLDDRTPTRGELTDDGFEEKAPEPVAIITPPPEAPKTLTAPGMPSKGQSYAGWIVLAVAMIGMVLVVGVVVDSWVQDARNPDQVTTTEPSPTPSPPPYQPKECFPLQRDC